MCDVTVFLRVLFWYNTSVHQTFTLMALTPSDHLYLNLFTAFKKICGTRLQIALRTSALSFRNLASPCRILHSAMLRVDPRDITWEAYPLKGNLGSNSICILSLINCDLKKVIKKTKGISGGS